MVFAAMKMATLRPTLTTQEAMLLKLMPAPPTRVKTTLITVITRFIIARTYAGWILLKSLEARTEKMTTDDERSR
jgi:hypothetical protein